MASRQYEDFQPHVETKETPDSILLLVHVPDFAREHVGANYESAYRRVKISGERPLQYNRWKRFNVERQIPESCESNKLGGKFEGGIITITMPKKKVISGVETKEEPKPTENVTPAKTSTEVGEEKGTDAAKLKATKDQEGVSDEEPKPRTESEREGGEKKVEAESKMPKKDQEGISQKGSEAITETGEKQTAEEKKVETSRSTPPKAIGESKMPQKDQEGIPQKGDGSVAENEEKQRIEKKETEEDDGKTSDVGKPEAIGESKMPQKDQEGITQKGDASIAENEEKQRAEKKETKEDNGKASEAGKPPQKDQAFAEKVSKEEKEESSKVATSPVPKTMETEKKEMNDTYGIFEPKGKGIKEVAASASQAVTRMAKRINEEDKQKFIYIGVAALVVAVGVYASYKFRSLARS